MTIQISNGTGWNVVDDMQIYNGSSWAQVAQVWIYDGSAWRRALYRDSQYITSGGSGVAWGYINGGFGSINDGTSDLFNGGIIQQLYSYVDFYYGNDGTAFQVSTSTPTNSGWETMIIGSEVWNRADANYSTDGSTYAMWQWGITSSALAGNVLVKWPDSAVNITFSPPGGTAGAPYDYSDFSDSGPVSFTITASSAVNWYYTRTGLGATSVANGASASSITMTQVQGTNDRTGTWNVYASDGTSNKYWTVTLDTVGTGFN